MWICAKGHVDGAFEKVDAEVDFVEGSTSMEEGSAMAKGSTREMCVACGESVTRYNVWSVKGASRSWSVRWT